jgi:hypothetical protein
MALMCQRLRVVISVALAVLLGVAASPLVLVFGPVYFPWTLLVLACFGGVVGLAIAPRGQRSRVLRALGLAVLMVAVVLGVLTLRSNMVLSPRVLFASLIWIGWLLFPILVGVLVGAWLRAGMGFARAVGTGAAAVLVIALSGAGLAFALAPPEVAGAPACDRGFECPRTQCAYMAERSRVLAIERVTAFDGVNITCTYTAWGGFEIGRADMGSRGGSWTDGAWPLFVSGRER